MLMYLQWVRELNALHSIKEICYRTKKLFLGDTKDRHVFSSFASVSIFFCVFNMQCISLSLSNPLFLMCYCNDGHRQNQEAYRSMTGSSLTLLLCCVTLRLVQTVTMRGRHFWSDNVWMGISEVFFLCVCWQGLKWLQHMLSLSERSLFWFAPAGDGVESAWTLSIRAPVDQSELRSCPEIRRHGTDLLFRGYSLPVDLKTIKLCCWSNQGWARAVQDGWCAWTKTERQEKQTDRGV